MKITAQGFEKQRKSSQTDQRKVPANIRKCADWLNDCLRIGWDKSQLDGLEEIFWKHEGWRYR